jgi:hypothetical protein
MGRVGEEEVMAGGPDTGRCIWSLKLGLTRLRTEFNAFRETSKETRQHLEKETERRLELLNNKTAWVDKQQEEMKREYLPKPVYESEHEALCRRVSTLEAAHNISVGQSSRATLIALLALAVSVIISLIAVAELFMK